MLRVGLSKKLDPTFHKSIVIFFCIKFDFKKYLNGFSRLKSCDLVSMLGLGIPCDTKATPKTPTAPVVINTSPTYSPEIQGWCFWLGRPVWPWYEPAQRSKAKETQKLSTPIGQEQNFGQKEFTPRFVFKV